MTNPISILIDKLTFGTDADVLQAYDAAMALGYDSLDAAITEYYAIDAANKALQDELATALSECVETWEPFD